MVTGIQDGCLALEKGGGYGFQFGVAFLSSN